MKTGIAILLVLAATVECSAPQQSGVRGIAWLQGCWERVSPEITIEEQWMAPLGNNMVGVSRTVRADSLTSFEIVVIREQGNRLIYEAHPSGQPAAAFHSSTIQDSSVVFENLEHDFPQRIGYRRSSPDSLTAWIEGSGDGGQRRVEFLYSRAACPGV